MTSSRLGNGLLRMSFCALLATFIFQTATAQVPGIINYQGRIVVGGTNFTGTGQFRFALVDGTGATTFWSNGTATVSVPVTKGLYAVLLGDTTVANMASSIPSAIFANPDVRLRVWFNDGVTGLQQLTPDQRLGTVGFAQIAANVPDGAITSNKLAAGAVTSAQLAPNLTVSGTLTAGSFQGNGAGLTNLPGSGGGSTWQVVTGTTQQATANTSYVLTNATQTTVTLPTTANVGDVVQVSGVGAGGWTVAGNILGLTASTNITWTAHPSGNNQNWQSVASSSDGTKLVAAVNGGLIWTSTDSGSTWTARGSTQNWQAVSSSSDGTKLVAVVNGGLIWTSMDSGATWTSRGGAGNQMWFSVASSADGTKFFAGGNTFACISADSGTNWTQCATNVCWQSVASSSDGTRLFAADNGGSIYLSTNAGANWSSSSIHYGGGQFTMYKVAASSDGTKLVAAGFYYNNGYNGIYIYRSTNSGLSWSVVTNSPALVWQAVASSSDGTRLVAVASGGQVWTSTDSGSSWTARGSSQNWSSVASSSDGTKLVAVVSGGSIWTSTNAGTNWTAQTGAASTNWSCVASSADGTKLVAAVNGGLIYISTDSGATWTPQASTQNWASVALSADGSKCVAAVNGGLIWTATGGGSTMGTGGMLAGAQGTTVTLQYIGNGQWEALTPVQSSSGSATLGAGSVTTANLASGAVTGDKIASGAVGTTQLAANLTASGTFSGTMAGDGSGLINLNASSLASGTVPDTLLSANVSLLNASQTFSGVKTFAATSIFNAPVNVAGTVTATSFGGNGIGLTNLNASQLAVGTVPGARLSGIYSNAVTFNNAANSFIGNGAYLNNLNANQITSGTVPSAQLSGNYASAMSLNNANNSFVGTFIGNGASLTNLNASQLASGTVPSAQLSGTYGNALALTNAANSFTGTFTGNGAGLTNVPMNGASVTNLNATQLASGTVPSARLAGTYSSAVTFNNAANSFTGTFTGNGAGLTNVPFNGASLTNLNASQLTSGTVPSARLSGTYASAVTLNNATNSFTGNGAGLTGLNGTNLMVGTIGSAQLATSLTLSGSFSGTFVGNGAGLTNLPTTVTNLSGGGSGFAWQAASGTNQQAAANTGYVLTNAAPTAVTLPATANVGDIVQVSGVGAGGWSVAGNIAGGNGPVGVNWTAQAGSGNQNWEAVASSTDGTKLVAVVYPNGQIWTSPNSGATWTPRASTQNWASVASSADGTKQVAVVYGGQIFTSKDAGMTWTPTGNIRNWVSVASSTDGTKLVALDAGNWPSGGYIWTSTDAGTSWTQRASSQVWQTTASSADGTKLIAADVSVSDNSGYIYTSTNAGVTWTSQINDPTPYVSVASSADGTKLVAVDSGGQIWTSSNSGLTWASQTLAGNPQLQSVASSADGTKLVVAANGGQLYTSQDSGATWTPQASVQNWYAVASSADGTKLVAAVYGGPIYISSPSLIGASGTAATLQYVGNGQWQPLDAQIPAGSVGSTQLASNLTVSGTLTAGSFQGNGVLPWQTVAGVTQQAVPNTGYGVTNGAAQVTISLPASPNLWDVVRVSGPGAGGWKLAQNAGQSVLDESAVCSAISFGSNWVARTTGFDKANWVTVASSPDGTNLVASGLYGAPIVVVSADSGQTWALSPPSGSAYYTSIAMSSRGMVAVGKQGDGSSALFTSGGGVCGNAPATNWVSIASSSDGTKLVAAVGGGQLWTSSNAGTNWTAQASTQNWQSVAMSADGSEVIAVVNGGSVYTSTHVFDTGTTTVGTNGYLTGSQGTAIELQYIGNGQFMPLSHEGTIIGY